LPLKKAEFDKNTRLLELFWEKGVPSSTYIPEDERPGSGSRSGTAHDNKRKETDDAQRRQMDTGTMSVDEQDALFDDDDDAVSEITGMTSGVSLNADRPTQSMPPSPTKNGITSGQGPYRTKSDSRLSHSAGGVTETKLRNKDMWMELFTLREQGGDYIQDVREMTRIPIILKTDLTKSPP
ncbi:hypothetical protein LTS18_001855, partial [Coniosporium uncinatum]